MVSIGECCFRTARWFPVVFIFAVICWSYYAYVVELLVNTIPEENVAEKVILGLLYHPVLFMFLWAYYKIVYTDPKAPPIQFYLTTEQVRPLKEAEIAQDREKMAEILEHYVKPLPVFTRTFNQGVRYCEICNCIKPDRAHHCSVCKKCVLKMDHHCPWVNNCVSFINYKFFILFLLYAEVYCLYVAFSDLKYFVGFWKNSKILRASDLSVTTVAGLNNTMSSGITKEKMNFHVLFLFIVAIMFSFSVLGLLGYHIYLVLKNQSTLESFRPATMKNSGPDKKVFNLGRRRNWTEVFGDDPKRWFLPVISCKGDGVTYPTRYETHTTGYNTMENGNSMLVP